MILKSLAVPISRLLNYFLVLLLLSGCVVRSQQADYLMDLIKKPDINLLENAWSLQFKGYKSIVYAVSIPGGTLFSNKNGDHLIFNGWSITNVTIKDSKIVNVKIEGEGKKRNFKSGNRVISTHFCDGWFREKNRNLEKLSQSCKGAKAYSNTLIVDELGNISLIRQIVDDKYSSLTLSKLK